eukprot:gene11421-13311_t
MPNTPKTIYDDYDITDIIGEGTFSSVTLAKRKSSNDQYAVKIIDKECLNSIQRREMVDWEISILSRCNHPNIVEFYEYFESDEDIYGDVKLADFGLSKYYEESVGMEAACGTPAYSAPEINNNQVYRKAVDMWSCGCILYFILFGRPPFYHNDESQIYKLVAQGKWSFPNNATECTDDVRDMIKGLLEHDPTKRLTVKAALSHKWLTQKTIGESIEASTSPLIQPSPCAGFNLEAIHQQPQHQSKPVSSSSLRGSSSSGKLRFSDQRIKLIGEFISGIRFLKLYNWEQSFIDRIDTQRNQQLKSSRIRLLLWALDRTVAQVTTGIVLLVTFMTYTLSGHTLTASTAFPAVTIFLSLRKPLQMAPDAFQRLLMCLSSCTRLEEYLCSGESHGCNNIEASGIPATSDIVIENGQFDWNDEIRVVADHAAGRNEDLTGLFMKEVSQDQVPDIQGKSVLNDINFLAPAGKLTVIVGRVGQGKTSLVSALIGEIQRVYGTVKTPSSIGYTPQIPWLVNGSIRDNILFGAPYNQKRYALVIEACCLKPDLIQLPAKDLTEIGESGINLSGGQKQRISLARCLYSNHEAYIMDEPLSAVDAEVGKHLFDLCIQGLMANHTRILVTHQLQFLPSADHIVVMEGGTILVQGTFEHLQSSGIDFQSIIKTKAIRDCNEQGTKQHHIIEQPDIPITDCIVMGDATDDLVKKSKLFVKEDRNQGVIGFETYFPYLKSGGPTSVYALLILVVGILLAIRHLGIAYITWRASQVLHQRLINGVFFSPCSFFDQNPSGRILNRFSKDISEIDNKLIGYIADVLSYGSIVIVSLAMVVFLAPPVIIPFLFIKSFQGLNSIRIFKQQDRFIGEMNKRIDLNQRLVFHTFALNRWLSMTTPARAGMAVSAALSVTGCLNWTIRQFTEVEVRMNSVERVLSYINSPREGNPEKEVNSPPAGWPPTGQIDFHNFEVKYRPTMDPSIRGLTASIPPGSKVGIVGRTGAGKSTIGISLFRMIEASSGSIDIDGIDISTIGLSDLRSRLAVIPQDSFVYSSNVRMNLDPFGQHSDLEIWNALEQVHLKSTIDNLSLKLDHSLDEGGNGLSIGQKQLLCLARALLRDTKIVLMDEATASLDYETDSLIKDAIKVHFKDRTVLTIAHRLDTIIDSDLVMVIDNGQLIEYDTPQSLLQKDSRFKQLVIAQSTH